MELLTLYVDYLRSLQKHVIWDLFASHRSDAWGISNSKDTLVIHALDTLSEDPGTINLLIEHHRQSSLIQSTDISWCARKSGCLWDQTCLTGSLLEYLQHLSKDAIWDFFGAHRPVSWKRSYTKTALIDRALHFLLVHPDLVLLLHDHHRKCEHEKSQLVLARDRARHAERRAHNLKDTVLDPLVQQYEYLGLPDTASMCRCLSRYIQATDRNTLQKAACACCARSDFERLMHPDLFTYHSDNVPQNVLGIPSRHLLFPIPNLPLHHLELFDGLLLHSPAVNQTDCTLRLCSECYTSLSKKNPACPRFALARGLWTGSVPEELQILTLPERLLIARAFPRAYLIKLRTSNTYRKPLKMP